MTRHWQYWHLAFEGCLVAILTAQIVINRMTAKMLRSLHERIKDLEKCQMKK